MARDGGLRGAGLRGEVVRECVVVRAGVGCLLVEQFLRGGELLVGGLRDSLQTTVGIICPLEVLTCMLLLLFALIK